ncbi:hypothetical protein CDL15_Pgr005765 [Punica granatum]|uniref:Uncharacterized protein n=1 Tax=Punica granatum TaxID=22663 RepID=A0A218WGF8_PUNGR|nr:hypothetical protein CDL15_Pgr005765 [Punica granatum]PKI33785.1 hypothetical protein CRG98_045816 [Punica granatum]
MHGGVGPIANLCPPFQREREEGRSAIGLRLAATRLPNDFARCFSCVRRGRLGGRQLEGVPPPPICPPFSLEHSGSPALPPIVREGGEGGEDELDHEEDLDGAAIEPLHDAVVEGEEGSRGQRRRQKGGEWR